MLMDNEWLALMLGGESERVEFKPSLSQRKQIRRAICAFSNDLAAQGLPGLIFVGVEDDGSCARLKITDKIIRDLAAMRDAGNIQPIPSLEVYTKTLKEGSMAIVEVRPADNPPVRYEGRVWVRVGSTNRKATPSEELILAERRRAGDLPFDYRPVRDASLTDLDLDYFGREYLASAIAPEVLEENRRSVDERLVSLRFLTAGHPNYGAIITLGTDPQRFVPGAYLQFLRVDGLALGDPIKDEKMLSGPLHQIMARVDELLGINIRKAVDIEAGNQEFVEPDYPVRALQQLVRNALIHRSYEGTNAPVRLNWFADRVEISNPGGLYGWVTPENFGKGATDYRNPLIAEAMGVLGFVQRYGYGVPLAQRLLRENHNPPAKFDFDPNYVLVTIGARS